MSGLNCKLSRTRLGQFGEVESNQIWCVYLLISKCNNRSTPLDERCDYPVDSRLQIRNPLIPPVLVWQSVKSAVKLNLQSKRPKRFRSATDRQQRSFRRSVQNWKTIRGVWRLSSFWLSFPNAPEWHPNRRIILTVIMFNSFLIWLIINPTTIRH